MGLAVLLREHRGPIVADFRRYYGIPLARARHEMTLSEFAHCVLHLPPDSALGRALNPDWQITTDTWLLRQVEIGIRRLEWRQTRDGQADPPRGVPEALPVTAEQMRAIEALHVKSGDAKADVMSRDEMARRLGWAT